jgi:hypothetical protein
MAITYVQTLSAKSPQLNGHVGSIGNALTYDTVIASAHDYSSGTFDGAFYVFDRVPATTRYSYVSGVSATKGSQIALGASNAVNTNFIYSGAPNYNSGQGIVYEYKNTAPGRFGVTSSITSTARNRKGYLGAKLKLVDSTHLLISAPTAETTTVGAARGAVHLYDKTSGTWTWSASISSNDSSNLDQFGFAFDGTLGEVIAGAPYYNNSTGAAYLFAPGADPKTYSNTQIIRLNGSGGLNGPWSGQTEVIGVTLGSMFGYDIAVSTNYLVIGAPGMKLKTAYGEYYPGAAFLYVRAGILWTYASILTADFGGFLGDIYFGESVAINESNNTVLVGCKGINGLEGKVYGFNISNPSDPIQNFAISRPTNVPNAQFGYKLNVDSSIDGGALLAGNRGALVTPDNGSVFPVECGGVLLFNGINSISPTPTPTVTITPTPSPTPPPTPVLKPLNWYGLNPLDPVSVGDGGGTPGGNYPKTPALGGPGRNYSILRELNVAFATNPGVYDFDTYRGSLKNLAVAYFQFCLNNGMTAGDTTAMSEFQRSRGVSLGFTFSGTKKDSTPSKYCDRNDGSMTITIFSYPTQGRYGNPIRTTTYSITINGSTTVGTTKTVNGLVNGSSIPWSVVDNSTGYTRSGNVGIGCSGATSTFVDINYKTDWPTNPPI